MGKPIPYTVRRKIFAALTGSGSFKVLSLDALPGDHSICTAPARCKTPGFHQCSEPGYRNMRIHSCPNSLIKKPLPNRRMAAVFCGFLLRYIAD